MADPTPFTIPLSVVLTSNALGTVQYPVPPNQRLLVKKLWATSTGIFQVNDMRTSTNYRITVASASVPIPSTHLQIAGSANFGINEFNPPWSIGGTVILYIDVQDTSGAGNTIRITLQGEMQFT